MVRKHERHSRAPRLTENEIALQWELQGTRAELAALRKAQEAADQDVIKALPPMDDMRRARLMMKIERISRRTVREWTPANEFCPHCGGVSFVQHEEAFRCEAKRLGLDLDEEGQTSWPWIRDEPEESLYHSGRSSTDREPNES